MIVQSFTFIYISEYFSGALNLKV